MSECCVIKLEQNFCNQEADLQTTGLQPADKMATVRATRKLKKTKYELDPEAVDQIVSQTGHSDTKPYLIRWWNATKTITKYEINEALTNRVFRAEFNKIYNRMRVHAYHLIHVLWPSQKRARTYRLNQIEIEINALIALTLDCQRYIDLLGASNQTSETPLPQHEEDSEEECEDPTV